jgi:Skp family chaperone for outer membrane proteins
MKTLIKSAFVAATLATTAIAAPAIAQSGNTPPLAVAPGLGVANLDAVVANSNAYKTAQTQRLTTNKAQFDQAEARRKAIAAQLQPMADKFNKDRAAPGADQNALRQQAAIIQQLQQSGQQELQGILQPVALSEAYVQEQINDKLVTAVQNAMAKRKISILVNPTAIISANNAYNLNQSVLDELNVLLPSAQIVPPAGWDPREVREQRAAEAAQGGAPAAAAPAKKPTSGR